MESVDWKGFSPCYGRASQHKATWLHPCSRRLQYNERSSPVHWRWEPLPGGGAQMSQGAAIHPSKPAFQA